MKRSPSLMQGLEKCRAAADQAFLIPPGCYVTPDVVRAEDIPALVNQYRGQSCPDARQGRFQPLLEPNVAAFAHWYAGAMAQEMARASNQL